MANSSDNSKSMIKVIGVGGAGCKIVDHMMGGAFAGAEFAAVNTDEAGLAQCQAGEKALLETNLMKGMGTGGDANLGRVAAEANVDRLKEMCAGHRVVFLVAGLGGGSASGVCPVLAKVAKEAGALVLAFVTLPFECEGQLRQTQARAGLEKLKTTADGVICLPNQNVFKLAGENTTLLEIFETTNEILLSGMRSLWRMLTSKGLIEVNFTDLSSVVRGRHSESSFATATASGNNRSREVMDQLLAHPMLDDGHLLEQAGSVLVSIAGGPDLSMAEVNRIIERVNRVAEGAQVVMGASVHTELEHSVEVTMVVTRRDPRDPVENKGRKARVKDDFDTEFLSKEPTPRPASRLLPEPPELSEVERKAVLDMKKNMGIGKSPSKGKLHQSTLPLEIVSKGRFDQTEPTVHNGEDLDIPTYIRRGVGLN